MHRQGLHSKLAPSYACFICKHRHDLKMHSIRNKCHQILYYNLKENTSLHICSYYITGTLFWNGNIPFTFTNPSSIHYSNGSRRGWKLVGALAPIFQRSTTVIPKIKKYIRFNLDLFHNYRHSLIFSVIVKILDIPRLSTFFGWLNQGYQSGLGLGADLGNIAYKVHQKASNCNSACNSF